MSGDDDRQPVSLILSRHEFRTLLAAVRATRAEYGRVLTRLGLNRAVAEKATTELARLESVERALVQAGEDAVAFERALQRGETTALQGQALVEARELAAEAADALRTSGLTVGRLRTILANARRGASVYIEHPSGMRLATDASFDRGDVLISYTR